MTVQEQLVAVVREFQVGRLPEAEDACRDILRSDPNQAVAWNVLGIIVMERKEFAEAVEYFSRALAIKADVPDFLCNRALASRAMGKIEEA
ncbi:MAG TPA: tetratricopeptide repeat protein, partial [Tepidisphaeraceae bacterium]|nr:tetratricopeptide repeat protein [Tepidisphaeraceae bacterium]